MEHVDTANSQTSSTNQGDGATVPLPTITVIGGSYLPVRAHWFYLRVTENKQMWRPMSRLDSGRLEEAYMGADDSADPVVSTDGGRYDVHLDERIRFPIYWDQKPSPIRRCTWFHKMTGDKNYVPYPEDVADKLEEQYERICVNGYWDQPIEVPGGDLYLVRSPAEIVPFIQLTSAETVPEGATSRKLICRGVDNFDNITEGDAVQIDHVVFVVHGIGAMCDLWFRSLPQVVGDMRPLAKQLLDTHYKKHVDDGTIGRVEFLPVSWHNTLHGETTGIDRKLKEITLSSVPKLRHLANDTILDVLFYCSPVYCQTIVDHVGNEINRLYRLFLSRNPTFGGKVSLCGHSLGTVILFDLLLHQRDPDDTIQAPRRLSPVKEQPGQGDLLRSEDTVSACLKSLGLGELSDLFDREKIDMAALMMLTEADLRVLGVPMGPTKKITNYINSRKSPAQSTVQARQEARARKTSVASCVNYLVSGDGTGQPLVNYPRLMFRPANFFALGSPISIFLTVRGIDQLQEDFRLPTCPAFFNIFHPFDPVAYRIEPLIDSSAPRQPTLIPHHKGRKRMHLEIKDSLARVGSDLKHRVFGSLWNTWTTINGRSSTSGSEEKLTSTSGGERRRTSTSGGEGKRTSTTGNEYIDAWLQGASNSDEPEIVNDDDITIGKLNGGRRIDYVLQEKPIESVSDYIFSLHSHLCYWESEDTVLLMLKEVYTGMGVYPTPQGAAALTNKPPTLYKVAPTGNL